jgi:hypothetical protein
MAGYPQLPSLPKLPKPPSKRGLAGSAQRFGTQLGAYGRLTLPQLPKFAAMIWNDHKGTNKRKPKT